MLAMKQGGRQCNCLRRAYMVEYVSYPNTLVQGRLGGGSSTAVEREHQRATSATGRATLGAIRFMAESKLAPVRALLGSRQARFAQRLVARPEGQRDSKSIGLCAGAEASEVAHVAPGDTAERQEWSGLRSFPGAVVEKKGESRDSGESQERHEAREKNKEVFDAGLYAVAQVLKGRPAETAPFSRARRRRSGQRYARLLRNDGVSLRWTQGSREVTNGPRRRPGASATRCKEHLPRDEPGLRVQKHHGGHRPPEKRIRKELGSERKALAAVSIGEYNMPNYTGM